MTDQHDEILATLKEISGSMERLRSLMKNPEDLSFGRLHRGFEAFEYAFNNKTVIDGAFAFLAEREDAGRQVGSSKAIDYLMARLGLDFATARERLETGRDLFSPLDEAAPTPEPTPLPDDVQAVSDGERARQQAADAEAQRRAQAEKEAEERRRKRLLEDGQTTSAKVLAMIESELKHLNRHATPGHKQLRERALEKAKDTSLHTLRDWLRKQIKNANLAARTPEGTKDKDAAYKKRRLVLSNPDADGGVHVRGYLDPATAALVKSALTNARNADNAALKESGLDQEDKRTFQERNVDHLRYICRRYLSSKDQSTGGAAGLLVTLTMNDLENMTGDSRFPTTAGISVSPLDLLRMGLAEHDFLCVLDPHGFPLELARNKRTASLWQKIALAASELVCTHPDCNRAWVDCDVHHVIAWALGGDTDISNLTLRCRRHHVDNNDFRDGANNMGHADRSPETRRTGHRAGPGQPLRFNESPAAQQSCGHKVRHRGTPPTGTSPGPRAGFASGGEAPPPDPHSQAPLFS